MRETRVHSRHQTLDGVGDAFEGRDTHLFLVEASSLAYDLGIERRSELLRDDFGAISLRGDRGAYVITSGKRPQ